jgi:NADH dehydrogenase FAD-containing subunit
MTAVEVAANVAYLARRRGAAVAVALYAADELLAGLPRPVADGVGRLLAGAEIVVHTGSRVLGVESRSITLADGRSALADIVVNASGLAPAPLLASLGLPLERGGLVVDETLSSPVADHIFGGGDCIALAGHRLPRIGVHAIRQAPVLLHNLLARIEERPLQPFVPQAHCLTIMNLGDGRGLALRNGLAWRGRLAWWLKHAIDRRFLDTYRRLPLPQAGTAFDPTPPRSHA